MKALKCDICGSFFNSLTCLSVIKKTTSPNKLYMYYHANNGNKQDNCFLDICPDCYAAIKKTIDARRKTVDPMEDDLK